MGTFLTLDSDAFLRPVFHLSGEDSSGPDTDYIVGQVELQRVEAKHFHPEKPDFHGRMRALKHQRNLRGNTDITNVQVLVRIVDWMPKNPR